VTPEVNLHAVPVSPDIVLVVAVTREAAARAHLARLLPADSVLLMVPDYPTAVDALATGVLSSQLDRPQVSDAVIRLGGLEVDRLRQRVTWNGIPLQLTRLERGIIGCLAEVPAEVWAYERLYHAVWQEAWLGDTAPLHATVKRLRQKLRDSEVPAFLDSVRGVGFRLRVDTAPSRLTA
jgi:DNA-binding response OmpR family regulator